MKRRAPGPVEVEALLGTKVSDTGRLELYCEECICTAVPTHLTLRFAE